MVPIWCPFKSPIRSTFVSVRVVVWFVSWRLCIICITSGFWAFLALGFDIAPVFNRLAQLDALLMPDILTTETSAPSGMSAMGIELLMFPRPGIHNRNKDPAGNTRLTWSLIACPRASDANGNFFRESAAGPVNPWGIRVRTRSPADPPPASSCALEEGLPLPALSPPAATPIS